MTAFRSNDERNGELYWFVPYKFLFNLFLKKLFTVETPEHDLELTKIISTTLFLLLIFLIFISYKQNAIEYSGRFSIDNDYVTTTIRGTQRRILTLSYRARFLTSFMG